MATTADIRNGAVILHQGKRLKVIEFLHVKPGKGPAFVRTKLKDIVSGKSVDVTFNAGTRLEFVRLEVVAMQFLYQDGEHFVFMDNQTYEQTLVPSPRIGPARHFLTAGTVLELLLDGEEILEVRLPAHVQLEVTRTEPGLRGNTATGVTKPALLETGYELQVPLFIEEGDHLVVDTRTGEYIERAKSS